ncbi:MAG: type IV toxin-antitoxin system AbiEi family antitoxin domain-containing protein [Candidatus Omnitrophica bacterium]|nr:type IV toxin-antitoxin system AbiEi family antitoxin domain-containing protein [Candidatus Omnitrophota bacterium]
MISGISETNRKLLDDLARNQKGPFSVKEASKILGLPKSKIRIILAYLVRKGWLSRVRRGLYISVPLGTVNPQEYKEHPWIVVDRVFGPCYIGGWSAAEHWELTDQIFNSLVVFTLRKFKNTRMNIQGTDYVIKRISKKYFGKTKVVWVENIKVQVSDPLQTIVDILDDPFIGGGMRNVADIVQEYFKSQHRNDDEIVKYIDRKNNRTVYKRLGFLIEFFSIDAAKLKESCKERISAGFSLLDPTIEAKGAFNSKWNLRINVSMNK